LVSSSPRDRHGRFNPTLITKYSRRFPDFDEKIIARNARGMSTRDIRVQVDELYRVLVSRNLISVLTDSVIDAVARGDHDH